MAHIIINKSDIQLLNLGLTLLNEKLLKQKEAAIFESPHDMQLITIYKSRLEQLRQLQKSISVVKPNINIQISA